MANFRKETQQGDSARVKHRDMDISRARLLWAVAVKMNQLLLVFILGSASQGSNSRERESVRQTQSTALCDWVGWGSPPWLTILPRLLLAEEGKFLKGVCGAATKRRARAPEPSTFPFIWTGHRKTTVLLIASLKLNDLKTGRTKFLVSVPDWAFSKFTLLKLWQVRLFPYWGYWSFEAALTLTWAV